MKFPAAEKAMLYRELAKLIGADFHVDRAVELLLGQEPRGARKLYLEGLQRGLAEGAGVAAALESENGKLITGMEIALVSAGESSGKLAQPFEHLARYFSAMDAGVRQAKSALIYPLILAHLGILLPAVPSIFLDTVAAGLASPVFKICIFWMVVGVAWFGWGFLSEKAVSSAAVDALLNKLPLVGKVRRHWALARFTQVFHAGLLAAMRMTHITRMAGEASQSGTFREGAERAAIRIEKGSPLAVGLREARAFPRMFVDSVATAEEVGSVDHEMLRWANAEAELAGEATQRAATWMPKVGYILVVGYVAWQIISMVQGIYAPMYRLLEEG
jgi:type II secretory pathway component PulF